METRTAWAVVLSILLLIHLPSVTTDTLLARRFLDYLHIPAFALMAGTIGTYFRTGAVKRKHSLLEAILVTFLLAVSSEALQTLDPCRTVSPGDILSNLAGATIGLTSSVFIQQSRRRRILVLAAAASTLVALAPIATFASHIYRRAVLPTLLSGQYWRLQAPLAVEYNSTAKPVRAGGNQRDAGLLVSGSANKHFGVLVQELKLPAIASVELCVDLQNPRDEFVRVSVSLGDSLHFFQSTSYASLAVALPGNKRRTLCRAMPLVTDGRDSAYASLALLAWTNRNAAFVVHRVWLKLDNL